MKIYFRGADPNNKEFLYNIYIEFYSQGNIVLTDSEDVILACLREHVFDENNKVQKDSVYPLALTAPMGKGSLDKIESKLEEIKDQKFNLTQIVSQCAPCVH